MATTPGSSTYRSVSKSLPATPKHRSSARVEFQTEFPEHCQIFDGHMKVRHHITHTTIWIDSLFWPNMGNVQGTFGDFWGEFYLERCLVILLLLKPSSPYQVLNKRFGNIKGAVSDLHRDVTTRRCLTSYDRVEDIVRECVTIKTELDKADDMMDDHKMEFEKRWQQEQMRIKTEQLMFNEQVGKDSRPVFYSPRKFSSSRCTSPRLAFLKR